MGSETEWNYTGMECISQQETLKFTSKPVESSVKYSKGGCRAVYVPCLGEQNRLLSDQDNTQPRKKKKQRFLEHQEDQYSFLFAGT